jgi:histidine ammonia-lyase
MIVSMTATEADALRASYMAKAAAREAAADALRAARAERAAFEAALHTVRPTPDEIAAAEGLRATWARDYDESRARGWSTE